MTSAINPTVPVGPVGHAPDMRTNFAAAKTEIEALQADNATLQSEVVTLQDKVAVLQNAPPSMPLMGVTDGSDAASGQVGELLRNIITTQNAVVNGIAADVATLNLTPGDWDVFGNIVTSGSSTKVSDIKIWLSNQSRTLPTAADMATFAISELNFGTGGQAGVNTNTQIATGPTRVNITTPTTMYLSCSIAWSGGTVATAGGIRARRMR